MTETIPLPNGGQIIGERKHGRWVAGEAFAWERNLYQFLGKATDGTLHALRLSDQKLCRFAESREWEKTGKETR